MLKWGLYTLGLQQDVVYGAEVISYDQNNLPNPPATYTGGAQEFKPRYHAHCSSFRDEKRKTETMLSEHIWELQQQHINYAINWKIIEKTSGFNPVTLQCKICLSEIYHILVNSNSGQASLNRRLETYSYCRHLKKYLLSKAQYFYTKGGALLLKSGR